MNKNTVKNFAVWARRKLIEDIRYKASMIGVTENGIASPVKNSTNSVQYINIGTNQLVEVKGAELAQRTAFIDLIQSREAEVGYKEAYRLAVDKIAYTWFNRLIAIRFMEVNDYLPCGMRVLSSENPNKAEPDIVTSPFDSELPLLDTDRAYILKLKDENRLEELFRWLFVRVCRNLASVLPVLFQAKENYFEILLTISFTDKDGVLWHLVHDLPEQYFRVRTAEDDERLKTGEVTEEDLPAGQVEIIGWMYQYYNTEPKDKVFADLKKNVKISKDNIPAATQLFTPDWIVRYMVENSLGRLWVEGHPNESLKANWRYYLEEANQEPAVEEQLREIRREYAAHRPEEIRVIDPCMGSGHILVYLFDVLMQIYESQGWTQRDAAQSIVKNNLFGLDIDERAAQLAYFAVMMKARQYDRRFFERGIEPRVYDIRESNGIKRSTIEIFAGKDYKLEEDMTVLLRELTDAREYGSILNVSAADFLGIRHRLEVLANTSDMACTAAAHELTPLVCRAEVMAQKYDVVVTNPPYMGSSGMNDKLSDYVKKAYPDSKSDLFAVFIERGFGLLKQNGLESMITMESWMFLSSFEKLRNRVIHEKTICTLIHMPYLGKGGTSLGINFGTDMAVIRNISLTKYNGTYDRISHYETDDEGVPFEFPVRNKYYNITNQCNFTKIPGAPVAYWVSETFANLFSKKTIRDVAFAGIGMRTGDNDRFLRLWFEVDNKKLFTDCLSADEALQKHAKWIPYNKGGDFRRWYGNNEYVVNWENDGFEIKENTRKVYPQLGENLGWKISNEKYYFREGITWTVVSSKYTSFRRYYGGAIISNSGQSVIMDDSNMLDYLTGLLNTTIVKEILDILSPTLGFESGYINKIPTIIDKGEKENIIHLVNRCIELSEEDWNSFETSWDFVHHPLVWNQKGLWDATATAATLFFYYAYHPKVSCPLEMCWLLWQGECNKRFDDLKKNEEELNRIFINIYGLNDELTPEVEDKDVTVRSANRERDIKSLISYAVGCMFGRYSLSTEGIAFAGGEFDSSKYRTYLPDPDNCIPITDEAYFEDDIVGRFVEFVREVWGEETLETNLTFIADSLPNKGASARDVIRAYFLNDFYKDHLKIYQKRPIYWLFDSGKANGFKALVYMHRWNADTVGNLRVEYLHRMQRVYESESARMKEIEESGKDAREIAKAEKRREKLTKQLKETRDYDAKLGHIALSRPVIDLDDGVKVNYRKVQTANDGIFYEVLADSANIMAKEK